MKKRKNIDVNLNKKFKAWVITGSILLLIPMLLSIITLVYVTRPEPPVTISEVCETSDCFEPLPHEV